MIKHMRSREEWLTIFQQQTDSGLSIAQFCRQNGLCNKHFCLRKKQILNGKPTDKPFVKVVTKNLTITPPKELNVTQHFFVCRIGSVDLRFQELPNVHWFTQFIKAVS